MVRFVPREERKKFKRLYTSDPTKDYAKDAQGALLFAGAKVRFSGLKSQRALNGHEGTCQHWDTENGRMHVQLKDGQVKSFNPINLYKIKEFKAKETEDHQTDRIHDIFIQFDHDGNGHLDYAEMKKLMATLGLDEKHFNAFRLGIDKDMDFEVEYSEFVDWAMGKAEHSRKTKLEVFWPEKIERSATLHTDSDSDSDVDVDHETELTMADVERLCGKQGADFPQHGLQLINNMHRRFPEYPIQGILMQANENDWIGGKVIYCIRKLGAVEIEVVQPTSLNVFPGAFPAIYKVHGFEEMPVYKKSGRSWAFQHLRDGLWPVAGELDAGEHFRVLEVKRSAEHGYCFGMIEFEHGKDGEEYWVNLGKELISPADQTRLLKQDEDLDTSDLQYSEASRVSP